MMQKDGEMPVVLAKNERRFKAKKRNLPSFCLKIESNSKKIL